MQLEREQTSKNKSSESIISIEIILLGEHIKPYKMLQSLELEQESEFTIMAKKIKKKVNYNSEMVK